ncbi:MAG: hypothetical protein ACRDP7_12850 [Trebonia sp.]
MSIDPDELRRLSRAYADASATREAQERVRQAQREAQLKAVAQQDYHDRYEEAATKFRSSLPGTVEDRLRYSASQGSSGSSIEVGTFRTYSGRAEHDAGKQVADEMAARINQIPGMRARVNDEQSSEIKTEYGGMHGTTATGRSTFKINKVTLRIERDS